MRKIIYKILFLPLIFIEDNLFSNKNIIKKILSLVFPFVLLMIWGFAWCLAVLFFLALFGIWYNSVGEYISIVTLIWATFFVIIPVLKKSKKMNILYGLSIVTTLLLAFQVFILRFTVVGGTIKERGIKDSQMVVVYLLHPKNLYQKGDLTTYSYDGVSRIGVIDFIDKKEVVFKDKKIPLKDLTGKVIYTF